MKTLLFCLALILSAQGYAQKFYTKTGQLDFEASVPAFEPVKASHENVTALVDTNTGDIAVLALMKGFRFRNALMEEHFNENYMESDTYPKAVFKGTIQDFSLESLASTNSLIVKGTLTLHGKSKEIETPVTLKSVDGAYVMHTEFSVAPADFGIEIPSVVSEKISDTISIIGNFNLVKK